MPVKPVTPGEYIREYLSKTGRASGREMFNAYNKVIQTMGYKKIKYKSFAAVLYYLQFLDLIRPIAKQPIPGRGVPETIYELTGRKAPEDVWRNPQVTYYTIKGHTITINGRTIPKVSLGTSRYRKLIKKIPPRPRGRPRKRQT